MRCLGAEAVVVTNASGGLHPDWDVGTICAMHDHLGLPTLGVSAGEGGKERPWKWLPADSSAIEQSLNPLIGANFPLGPRFPPTSDAYDPLLRLAFFQAAKSLNLSHLTTSGTYTYVSGPSYESRAECKFLRQAGADCVGMSTVAEVIAARQAGLRVLAISLITNKVVIKDYFDAKEAVEKGQDIEEVRKILEDDGREAASHEEVLQVGKMRAEDIRKLVEHVICNFEL
jgi:purine-nucleoside phosphorylase